MVARLHPDRPSRRPVEQRRPRRRRRAGARQARRPPPPQRPSQPPWASPDPRCAEATARRV